MAFGEGEGDTGCPPLQFMQQEERRQRAEAQQQQEQQAQQLQQLQQQQAESLTELEQMQVPGTTAKLSTPGLPIPLLPLLEHLPSHFHLPSPRARRCTSWQSRRGGSCAGWTRSTPWSSASGSNGWLPARR